MNKQVKKAYGPIFSMYAKEKGYYYLMLGKKTRFNLSTYY